MAQMHGGISTLELSQISNIQQPSIVNNKMLQNIREFKSIDLVKQSSELQTSDDGRHGINPVLLAKIQSNEDMHEHYLKRDVVIFDSDGRIVDQRVNDTISALNDESIPATTRMSMMRNMFEYVENVTPTDYENEEDRPRRKLSKIIKSTNIKKNFKKLFKLTS
jgi:hypothetical protein